MSNIDPFTEKAEGYFSQAVNWVKGHPKTVVVIGVVLIVLWIL